MKLMNKVAVITGSGSGIGRAAATLFSQEGAKISIVDVDRKNGEKTVELIRQKGFDAIFLKADVSKASDVRDMIDSTMAKYERLDILFNNAGIGMPFIPTEDVEESLWNRMIDVNLKSVFLGCKYTIPIMKNQKAGVIINTASISGVRPRPAMSPYSTSKGAVITFTKALAIELAPFKIRVNCINPVVVDSPFLNKNFDTSKLEEAKTAMLSTIPLGRLGKPEDVANAALYLASEESSMVTGINLDVDGGRGI